MPPIKHRGPKPARPREPLFSIRDIGERIGIEWTRLRALMSAHPNGRPKPVFKTAVTGSSAMANLYRVSEFKRWIAVNEIKA